MILLGKLAEDLIANYNVRILPSLSFSTRKVLDDSSYGILDIETPSDSGLFQINNEKFFYKYLTGSQFFLVERGFLNTPIQEHKTGSFIFQIEKEIIKNYDSRNTYDIKTQNNRIIIRNGIIETVRGFDAISQILCLTMEDVGNFIMNSYEITDAGSLEHIYRQELISRDPSVTDVQIVSTRPSLEPNKMEVIANVSVGGNIINNIQFVLPTKVSL